MFSLPSAMWALYPATDVFSPGRKSHNTSALMSTFNVAIRGSIAIVVISAIAIDLLPRVANG